VSYRYKRHIVDHICFNLIQKAKSDIVFDAVNDRKKFKMVSSLLNFFAQLLQVVDFFAQSSCTHIYSEMELMRYIIFSKMFFIEN